jgi:hypothetical protein
MIALTSLNIEWITEVSKSNRKADRILVEKVIRALLLLEGLLESGVPFVFKGGTALMLMLNSAKRLSIDIDVIMPEQLELAPAFATIVQTKGFSRFEIQERHRNLDIEKAHYKFFYSPSHRTAQAEEYILLDILFERHGYHKTVSIPVDSTFVQQQGEPLQVLVPSIEDILGDKLTAFAPNTTGIPYEKNGHGRAMEIIKQLYDIGCLCEHARDGEVVGATFNAFAAVELGYRQMEKSPEDVLEDIFDTALTIASRGLSGKGNYEALMKGINQIGNFIFSEAYHLERAITCASKAAYLATAIKSGTKQLARYEGPAQIRELTISHATGNKMNKLKRSNPEAFFYLHQAFNLMEAGKAPTPSAD